MTKYNGHRPEQLRAMFDDPNPPTTLIEVATGFGVQPRTFRNWVNGHPEFKSEYLKCKHLLQEELEGNLYKCAVGGYEVVEKKVTNYSDGTSRVEVTTKEAPPNASATKTILKVLDPEKYTERPEVEVRITPQSWIDLFDIAAAKTKDNLGTGGAGGTDPAPLPEKPGRVD